MFTRTIVIAGNPNITHTLYYDSRSNSLDAPEKRDGILVYLDDYGQRLNLNAEAIIISDLVQDGKEMLRAQGEAKIIEIKAQASLQKRFEGDAELKVMREEAARKQRASGAPPSPAPLPDNS